MSATAAMDARTLLGLLGRERRRLRRAREAAPRHAEYMVGFTPPGRARPRRQSQSEGAWRGRRPSTWAPLRRASAQPTHPYTSPALDEPNWIFYDELESVAAASSIWQRQKPQRFIRAFRALHISRSSTRLSPSDPSHSASPRPLGSNPASPVHLKHHLDSLVPISIALPACTRQSAVIYARERFPVGNAGCREGVRRWDRVAASLACVQRSWKRSTGLIRSTCLTQPPSTQP